MSGPRLHSLSGALAHSKEMAAELQLIGTRQLEDHVPLGLEFDHVQLTGQPAPGEKEAWNADPFMEGARVGTGRSDFLAALEDSVKAVEMRWAPLLQLHFPDQLDDYLNKVLVETGQRFFNKKQMDAPGYADLAARRRELLTQRLEARKNIGEDRLQGQEGLERSEELQQRVRAAEEQLARTSAPLKATRLRPRRRRQSFYEEELRLAWKRRDLAATFRWSRLLGGRRWGSRCRQHSPRERRRRTSVEATVLESWSEWRAQTRDLMKRSELKAEVVGEARKDLEELVSSFRTVKKRRACPAGSPLAEIWTMLLHASRNLSPGGLCFGNQRKKIEPVFTLSLVERLLCRVRSSGTAPLAWRHSSGAPLHKSNKAGPKGKRVGHMLPSVGKAVLQSSAEDEEGHVVTTCARRLAAWINPGKAARIGGPYQASHDMEAGTSWPEIAHGLSRPYPCILVGQVGGDGSSCGESVRTELPSWAAGIQAGDQYDPGQGWGCHAQN